MNTQDVETKLQNHCQQRLTAIMGGRKVVLRRLGGAHEPDFTVTLPTKPERVLIGECKANLVTRTQARHALLQLRGHVGRNERALIVAQWIPEVVAEELRAAGAYYMDMAGNAYLWDPPFLGIDIRGKKPPERPGAQPGRIVEPGGLKVCHLLLTQPKYLNKPLRAIAEKAGVALGTVHAVMRELQAAGFMLPKIERRRRFADWEGLLETFVQGYALKLRPACLIGRFHHRLLKPERIADGIQERLGDAGWALTGGLAARELTQYLKPDDVVLFADRAAEAKLKGEPMLQMRKGNVTVLRLFAPTVLGEKTGHWPLATPLLVYAELLHTGGPREMETAEMIMERHIKPGFERDA